MILKDFAYKFSFSISSFLAKDQSFIEISMILFLLKTRLQCGRRKTCNKRSKNKNDFQEIKQRERSTRQRIAIKGTRGALKINLHRGSAPPPLSTPALRFCSTFFISCWKNYFKYFRMAVALL